MLENKIKLVTDLLAVYAEIKSDFLQVLPNVFTGLVVFVLGFLLAHLLRFMCSISFRGLTKALPKRVLDKRIVHKNLPALAKILSRTVFFVIIFFTVTTAVDKMGLAIVSAWLEDLAKYLPNILASLVIAFAGWKLKELVAHTLFQGLSRAEFKRARVASNVIAWTVFVISLLVALEQIGVDMGLVVTISTVLIGVMAGGIVLTFALGAKATVSDILACYHIQRFMKVGQRIEVCGKIGTITSIGPTFLVLRTEDGQLVLPGDRFRREITLVKKSEAF